MILLVSYGGGHITMIVRIYNYLIEKNIDVKILPLTTAVSYCKKNFIDYLKIEDFIDTRSIDFKNEILEIAKKNHNHKMDFDFEHTLAYYTIGLSQILSEKGYEAGMKFFEKHGRKSFQPIAFAEKVITELKPSAIITTNIERTELAFRKVGITKNIPVFAIDDLDGYFGTTESIYSNFVFVDNIKAKTRVENYQDYGEVIVSGNPVFSDAIELKKIKKLNNNLLVILQTGIRNITSNEVYEFSDPFYENFFSNLEIIDFYNSFDKVTVRFHPSMGLKKYWKSDRIEIDKNVHIHQSLLDHHNVIGFTSTAVYEAYLMGSNIYNFSFGVDFFNLPIEYTGKINLSGEIRFNNKEIEPIQGSEINKQKPLDIIYEKLINEVFKN